MNFWAYMLHCRGGVFYIGHTDNLELRLGQHESGTIAGFIRTYAPATLVWSQEFPSRIEALEAERRLKGWSRAKKLALIRGDWDRISALAKGKNGPSTSSGRTELGKCAPSPVRAELVEAPSFPSESKKEDE
jgi:predicted GIY-YIG superfamily endonuclease